MKDYLALLSEIPVHHSGLIFEQLNTAARMATFVLRNHGMTLPGESSIPTFIKVREHLYDSVNRALDVYHSVVEKAPRTVKANEIWGEDGDDLFSVTVSGLTEAHEGGFTVEIDMNLLYGGE